jgi:hypothetical protein
MPDKPMQASRIVFSGLLLLWTFAFWSLACGAAELHLQVNDESNRPIWCRVEVRGADGRMYQASGAQLSGEKSARGGLPWYLGSFLMNGTGTVQLPAGRYTIVVEHGLEYQHFEQQVTVPQRESTEIKVRLRPWVRLEQNGWWSADMHVHRTVEQAPAVAEAEDLNLVVLTDRNKRELFKQLWPSMTVDRISAERWISEKNVEDERRGGSWILSGLEDQLTLEPESGWYPPGLDYVREARRQRAAGSNLPWFDIDMPIWWEVPVMVALETPDSIDIINNQFMQYGIDTGQYWGKPIDRVTYPGAMGFVNYTLDLYYRYLNLGFKISPSAGTGTGVMPSPAGYNRIYAHIDGPFTLEKWYGAVRSGQSFVTNGPILFFHAAQRGTRIGVEVQARAREPIVRVEIVANGKVIRTWTPASNRKHFHARADLDDPGYTWIAARCFLNTSYTVRLAHSAPVYLGGHSDASADRRYFLDWIDQLTAEIGEQLSKHALTEEQADALRTLYAQARAVYENR